MGLVPREPIIFLYLSVPVGEGLGDAVGGNFLTQGCSDWESLCTSWPALGQYTKTRGAQRSSAARALSPDIFEQGIRNSKLSNNPEKHRKYFGPLQREVDLQIKVAATPGTRTTSAGYSGTPNKFGHPGLRVIAPRRNHDRSNLSLRRGSASSRC